MNIKCPGCGQKYRGDPQCMPVTGAWVTCKQCDHAIKVSPGTSVAGGAPGARGAKRRAGFLQPSRLVFIGSAVVVLLGVMLWGAMNLFPRDNASSGGSASQGFHASPGASTRPKAGSESGAQAFASGDAFVTPVAGITLRAPALLKAVQGSAYAAKLPPAAQMGMVSLATLSLGSIDLFLCHDEAGVFWPVLRVEKPMARFLAGQFGPDGPLSAYFIQTGEFTFQLNESAITGILSQMLSARAAQGPTNMPSLDELSSVPLEQYSVVLEEDRVWLVPDCVRSALGQSPDVFEQASWRRWMAPVIRDEDVLRICAQMPGDIDTQWTSWVLEHAFVQAHPEAGIGSLVATMEAPVTALLKSVSGLEQVAVTVACPAADRRRVTWVQQFRDLTLAEKVYEQVQAAPVGDTLGGHPLMPLVMRLMNCPELQRTTDLKTGRLTVTFNWRESDDLAIFNQLGNVTAPDVPEEIESSESTEDEPVVDLADDRNGHAAELLQAVGLTRHLDESTWRAQVSDRFVQALVPSPNHGFGVRDARFLEMDAWGDNASLASVFYEVTQVMSPGNQVLADCLGAREKMVGRRIRIPVPDGTVVGEAVIEFDVTVPSDLDVALLDVSTGQEVTHGVGTGSVAMAKVSDRTVRLSYKGLSMPFVYAFDRLRNRLRRDRISREPDGVYLVFGGGVTTCLVVGVQAEISHTFEARVNLDPGPALALSYAPEVPQYTRFDHTPLVNYAQAVSLDVNDLVVHWRQEKQQSHFEQRLSVALPENVAVQPDWEVYAHHRQSCVRLNGASIIDNQQAAFLCRDFGARQADQMSGSVRLNVFGQIERVTFLPQDLEGMCCIKMPRGTYLDLTLDKNRLSYMVLGGDVVQLAAYDDHGRRLKQDPTWRFQHGMKNVYFWGVPDKVVLDISTQTKVATLDFSVTEPLGPRSQPQYTTSLPSLTR